MTAIAFLGCTACSSNVGDGTAEQSRAIVAFYAPAAIGDLSYGDAISLALHKSVFAHEITFVECFPADWNDAEQYATAYLSRTTGTDAAVLYVFCDGAYRAILESLSAQIAANDKQVLLIDSREVSASERIHTIFFPFYGMAFEAGVLANELIQESELIDIIIGDETNESLQVAVTAFKDGLGERSGEVSVNLTTDFAENGYDTAEELYWYYALMATVKQLGEVVQSLILPLCGGSVQGILRYNRDYGEESAYTIGVDTDMSAYSDRVPYSLVKHIDAALEQCVTQWLGNALPHHQTLGLDAGFTELVLSPAYKERLQSTLAAIHAEAIEKEQAYEKAN